MKTERRAFFQLHAAGLCILGAFLLCLTPALALGAKPACLSSNNGCNGTDIKDSVTQLLTDTGTLTNSFGNMVQNACQQGNTNHPKACSMLEEKANNMKGDQMRAEGENNRTSANGYEKMNRRHSKTTADGCNPTVQVCPSGSSSTDPSNPNEFDNQAGADTVANLTEADQDVQQANTILANSAPASLPPNYPALSNADYYFPWVPSVSVKLAAFEANLAAEKVKELTTPSLRETIVALGEGGNTSAAGTVFAAIYMVTSAVYENFEFVSGVTAEETGEGTYDRVADVYNALSTSTGDVNAIKTDVENILNVDLPAIEDNQKIITANQAAIIQYLETPPGRRTGFPLLKKLHQESPAPKALSSKPRTQVRQNRSMVIPRRVGAGSASAY